MFVVYVGVSKTITEHLVIWGCHHGPNCGNESSLCMEIICVLLQGLHEHWCDFTVRQFLDEIRPLHVRPNAGRYVQHWVTYKWNSLCPPTSFLPPPLSVTATHHFQKLIPLHVLLSPEGKKEEGYFDRRKICWSNSIRRSRSVCTIKCLRIQKWVSFTWSLANGVKVSSCHWCLLKLDRLLYWECSTIHHEFGECYFLYPQLRLC